MQQVGSTGTGSVQSPSSSTQAPEKQKSGELSHDQIIQKAMQKEASKDVAEMLPPKEMTGTHTTLQEIKELKHYSMSYLEGMNQKIAELETKIQSLGTVKNLISGKEMKADLQKMKSHREQAGAAYVAASKLEKDFPALAAKKLPSEVNKMCSRLRAPSTEGEKAHRQAELNERLTDIKIMVNGQPSRDTGSTLPLSKAVTEIWRTAGSTGVIDHGKTIMQPRADSGDRFAKVDEANISDRFQDTMRVVSQRTGGNLPTPNSKNMTECQNFAEALEKAGTMDPKTQRLVRSFAQALYTGSLTNQDIIKYASQEVGGSNLLYATIKAAGQQIQRSFYTDSNGQERYEIKIYLPIEMKQKDTKEVYATINVEYTLTCDANFEPISLTSDVPNPATFTTPPSSSPPPPTITPSVK